MINRYKKTPKAKKPLTSFFCPLCGVEREITRSYRLEARHYFQIALTSLVLMSATWYWMQEKSFFWPLIVWASFEFSIKSLSRSEIPCPHCGFDARWYKKDVKVAKKLVHNFWKNPQE